MIKQDNCVEATKEGIQRDSMIRNYGNCKSEFRELGSMRSLWMPSLVALVLLLFLCFSTTTPTNHPLYHSYIYHALLFNFSLSFPSLSLSLLCRGKWFEGSLQGPSNIKHMECEPCVITIMTRKYFL